MKEGDKVFIKYVARLADGSIIDASRAQEPLGFIIGGGGVVKGLEEKIKDMKVGEKRTIEVPPESAYGQRRQSLVLEMDRSRFPGEIRPAVEQEVQLRTSDGAVLSGRVVHVDEDRVTVDANHPLAGKTLIFNVELVAVG